MVSFNEIYLFCEIAKRKLKLKKVGLCAMVQGSKSHHQEHKVRFAIHLYLYLDSKTLK